MEKTITINTTPVKTWYWLGLNNVKIKWAEGERVEKNISSGKAEIKSEKDYTHQKLNITGNRDSVIFLNVYADKNLWIDTEIFGDKNVKIIATYFTRQNGLIYNRIYGDTGNNKNFEYTSIILGKGKTYIDLAWNLKGENSGAKINIGYLAQNVTDINTAVNHYGKNTASDINVSGSVTDGGEKSFKGTIDFKTGCKGAVGNELETVLLIGEDVVNKTLPIILCSEEDVVGTHGGSIGQLDEDTLFYFESRGITKEQAENILARRGVDRVLNMIADEETKEYINNRLTEVM